MRPEYEMEELVPIVGRLAEKYTAFESTSLPYEKAAQLMEAVLYCIREAEPSGGESALSPGRLSAQQAYEAGLARVKQKTRLALDRYNSILRNFVSYGNHCLEDTFLRGLPEFFKWYDPVFEPQNTILTLDYPVLKDLSGSTGIDRIHEWLCCVGLEQSFLEKFPESLVRCILEKYSHLYEELADNLCEIVIAAAAVHICAQVPFREADLNNTGAARIREYFSRTSPEEIKTGLAAAAGTFLRSYYGNGADLADYLSGSVSSVAVRLKTAAEHGSLPF